MKKPVYVIAGVLIFLMLAFVIVNVIFDARLNALRKDLDTKASVTSVEALSGTLHAGDSTNAQALADYQVQQKKENGKILARFSTLETNNQVLRAANTALLDTIKAFKNQYTTFVQSIEDSLQQHRQHMKTNFEAQRSKIQELAETFHTNQIAVSDRFALYERNQEKMREFVNDPLINLPIVNFFKHLRLEKPPATDSSAVPLRMQNHRSIL